MRRAIRGVGKACISAGVLILLFVAFELWGTGVLEHQHQTHLRHQFTATQTGVTKDAPAVPGTAIALLRIPKIGLNTAVVEGIDEGDLEQGPGHYPGTPLPGQLGNAAIAGHRTTYGAPFYRLDELKPGDQILITTHDSPTPFTFTVETNQSVGPGDVAVLDPTATAQLTLTTCTPRFDATQRLVVTAKLVSTVDPKPPAAPTAPMVKTLPGDQTTTLKGHSRSWIPVVLWGLVCAAIWAGAVLTAHRWRAVITYAVAAPVFAVFLVLFFLALAHALPSTV